MNKTINFYPYYKKLLLSNKKNTTIRLLKSRNSFHIDDVVTITSGWSDKNCSELFNAKIISISIKKIEQLTNIDLKGESPDCKSPEAVICTIGCIYKKILTLSDKVKIIKFKRIIRNHV